MDRKSNKELQLIIRGGITIMENLKRDTETVLPITNDNDNGLMMEMNLQSFVG